MVGVGVVQPLQIPAAVVRIGAGGVDAARHQLPQLLRRANRPRIATAHADDGDRLVLGLLELAHPPMRRAELTSDLAQVLAKALLVAHEGSISSSIRANISSSEAESRSASASPSGDSPAVSKLWTRALNARRRASTRARVCSSLAASCSSCSIRSNSSSIAGRAGPL